MSSGKTSKFKIKSFSNSDISNPGPDSFPRHDSNVHTLPSSDRQFSSSSGDNDGNYCDAAYFSDAAPDSKNVRNIRANSGKLSKGSVKSTASKGSSDDVEEVVGIHSLSSKFKTLLFKSSSLESNPPPTSTTHSSNPNSAGSVNNRSGSSVVNGSTRLAPAKIDEEDHEDEKEHPHNKSPIAQYGHLLIYPNNEHEHRLKKPKLDKSGVNILPGAQLLSGLLKVETKKADDGSVSIFSETKGLKLLQELKSQKMQTPASFIPKKNHRLRNDDDDDDESDEDSEPEVTDPAIDKPQLELINKLVELTKESKFLKHSAPKKDDITMSSAYGIPQGICGKGSYGIVKIVSKIDQKTKTEKFYAVKELKKKSGEDADHFSRRLISEFIISLSLNHVNIVRIYDLMRNSKGVYSEVLEFCDAGDLYSIISETKGEGLHYTEADCLFSQILCGVIFMHSKGIAHCDLKPENVLLTRNGGCKITDFGTSSVFKTAWEDDIHLNHGVCGSEPYVAPEEFTQKYYDPRLADVWALGVIYMVMRVGTYVWQVAKKDQDELYDKYLKRRPYEDEDGYLTKGKFDAIERLKNDGVSKSIAKCKRDTIYDILEPDPEERMTTLDIYETKWIKSLKGCRRLRA
ncbi:putative serine/threonine protein kinase [Saccharomycopsis crataegensis]|uniref:non-specific serine/threonine protein kinase n=1 Tax=Saccharomycopsis crataegensis TaxID=43959 RepID=A0AAV5QJU8_9ASCO|nr:putative serine/threonine protein kinase [Saccharomycopsis crataegensis]